MDRREMLKMAAVTALGGAVGGALANEKNLPVANIKDGKCLNAVELLKGKPWVEDHYSLKRSVLVWLDREHAFNDCGNCDAIVWGEVSLVQEVDHHGDASHTFESVDTSCTVLMPDSEGNINADCDPAELQIAQQMIGDDSVSRIAGELDRGQITVKQARELLADQSNNNIPKRKALAQKLFAIARQPNATALALKILS